MSSLCRTAQAPPGSTRRAPSPHLGSAEELADALAGLGWWNGLYPQERAYWLQQAGSAVPADAWEEFKEREVRS
jgi:hypothetical protein